MSALSDRPEGPIVGLPEPHESAVGHVTGSALYTDDIATGRKDALSAWPVQSTQAHARITALRTDPALAVPGVVKVLTADDVPGLNDAGIWGDEPLFPSEAMYYGQAMCWVLAESAEAARLGAAAVEVEYEPLPTIITITEAI
jgi:xanthine dehydrogenase large subunit